MKKYLITSTLLCLLALLPSNIFAIARVDENGKTIVGETTNGEYTTLVAPDEGVQDGNSSSIDPTTPEDKILSADDNDKAVSSDDENIEPYDGSYRDDVYTTTAQEDAELYANSEEENKDNDTLLIIICSILGVSLGSVGTFLFMLKRK